MILSDFLQRVNYRLRALDDDMPVIGTDEADYWVDTLNQKKDELYQDVAKQWSNTYSVLSLGTITASAAPVYNLPDTFLSAASTCYVIDTGGSRHDLDIIKAQDVDTYKQQVFIASSTPEKLYFTRPIPATDQLIGGTLYLPAHSMPADVSNSDENAVLPIPDANWAVYAVAAELAASDLSYEDKAADLNAKANNLYSLMVKKSTRGTAGNPRVTKYNVTRIGQRS